MRKSAFEQWSSPKRYRVPRSSKLYQVTRNQGQVCNMKGVLLQVEGRFGFSDFILGEGEQRRTEAEAVTSGILPESVINPSLIQSQTNTNTDLPVFVHIVQGESG